MIVTLLAWIYITIISLAWGNILLKMILPKEQVMTNQEPEWPLICLTGLCIIGALSLTLSLFMPLGWVAHLTISFPALLYYALPGNRHRVAGQFRLAFPKPGLSFFLLPASCMIVILVISADQVIHPDTLAYHAQAIHQMEYFGTIPGIVHVDNGVVAMSSTWFSLQAIFRFNFIHGHPYLFVNGCVVCWFCIFVCWKLTRAIVEHQNINLAPGWLLLLIFSFASWTQIRLTAASASPDFIAALLIWAACYFLVATPSKRSTFLTVLFSAAAVSMKLSAIPVLLLPVICIIQQFIHRKRPAVHLLLCPGSFGMSIHPAILFFHLLY
jgi:hypothetical protein